MATWPYPDVCTLSFVTFEVLRGETTLI